MESRIDCAACACVLVRAFCDAVGQRQSQRGLVVDGRCGEWGWRACACADWPALAVAIGWLEGMEEMGWDGMDG